MDLSYSVEEQAFRAEVRGFVSDNLPLELGQAVRDGRSLGKEGHDRWHALLHAQGWLAPNWPKEFGGCETSGVQPAISRSPVYREPTFCRSGGAGRD